MDSTNFLEVKLIMSQAIRLYVGTYSQEIYVYRMDLANGQLVAESQIDGVQSPSFLAIHPNNQFLYSVNEIGNYEGEETGSISAFSIERQSGQLDFLNRQPSHGTAPCHLSIDATGKYVLVANYGSGTVAAFPIDTNGYLKTASSVIQHEGSSINEQRQTSPHAHAIMVAPNNHHAFSPDLGLDQVIIYQLNNETGQLTPNEPPFVSVSPGQGPRHFDFHPSQRTAYVINEIGSTITVFDYQPEEGHLESVQTISTLPKEFNGNNSCADIHVSTNGQFVYGSNRGHDSIVIYSVDPANGQLTHVGHESTRGKSPRNFGLDPTGNYLLVANHGSDDIYVFRVDKQSGLLDYTGYSAQVPTPVCLKMISIDD